MSDQINQPNNSNNANNQNANNQNNGGGINYNKNYSQNQNKSSGFKFGVLGILIAVGVVLGFYCVSVYNKIVSQDEILKSAWAKVENQYKRRADFIPNLVNVVKGYAAHEKETLEGVINARANATKMNIDISKASEEDLKKFSKAQNELGGALSRLLMVTENYPDLKANANFENLQAQLEGTENRIAVVRKDYIDIVAKYNTFIRKFPTSLIASIFGLGGVKPTFSATEEERKAPVVSFK